MPQTDIYFLLYAGAARSNRSGSTNDFVSLFSELRPEGSGNLTGRDFQRALMAHAVYEIGGYTPYDSLVSASELEGMGIDPHSLYNFETGFYSALFRNNESGELTWAIRGTDDDFSFALGGDGRTNAGQLGGFETAHYNQAVRTGGQIAAQLGGNVSFTGHSLGGGLATAAGLVHNTNVTTFNTAGVHRNTIGRFNTDFSEANNLINNYMVFGDVLTYGQLGLSAFRTFIGSRRYTPQAVGNINILKPDEFSDPLTLQGMDVELNSK